MVLGGSVLPLVNFGGQTFKKVHAVRKVFLGMCLCDLVCVFKFYGFILDEIDVRSPNMCKSIFGLERPGKHPVGPTKGSIRRAHFLAKSCQN